MAGRHTVNARHPMALQAELKARMAAAPPPPPTAPSAPSAPVPTAPKSLVPMAGANISLKAKLESLPDEDLIQVALLNKIAKPHTLGRVNLVEALVAKNVRV